MRLIAVAVGPYAAEHLPSDAWRKAVLTCVNQAIPLAWIADLQRRADAELNQHAPRLCATAT